MAVLNIRNLSGDVHAQLRIRAAKAGRSMEAEARAILTKAVMNEADKLSATALQNWVNQLYGDQKPTDVVDSLIADRREEAAQENA
ncbi:MAG: plasmid stabilization protein [Anaerolineae bacterium]